MNIIDFERKGNIIRFYLGDSTKNYYGDDWNDIPYEHNAGRVYDEFIKGHTDLAIPFDYLVLEPCEGALNSVYCKDDMRDQKVPCIVIVSPETCEELGGSWAIDFQTVVDRDDVIKIYFGYDDAMINELKFE